MPGVKDAAKAAKGKIASTAKSGAKAVKSGAKTAGAAVKSGAKSAGAAAKSEVHDLKIDAMIAKVTAGREKIERHHTIFCGHVRASHRIVSEAHSAAAAAVKQKDWKTAFKHIDRISQAIKVIPENTAKAARLGRELDMIDDKVRDLRRKLHRDPKVKGSGMIEI